MAYKRRQQEDCIRCSLITFLIIVNLAGGIRLPIFGIYHVTAVTSNPQRNIDFYTGVLGLRLVKLTVNQDDPTTYYLYYGDEIGRPAAVSQTAFAQENITYSTYSDEDLSFEYREGWLVEEKTA